MNAADVIGYAFEADVHCLDCTAARFPHPDIATDREGNPVHPIFAEGENLDDVCGDCFAPLVE